MIAGAHAVLWVRQEGPGNDACRFADAEGGYLIDGSSTDADLNVLRYRIRARDDGTTRRVRIGAKSRIFVRRAPDDTWMLNGKPVPAVTGAKDVHFGFSPATFTLPIRRLKLGVGDEVELLVASLDLENERLDPLHVVIRRTAHDAYEWLETETGATSYLSVDAHGIVRTHKGHWSAQA
ncbi:putative glycolipid-binding domain-containing protein [Maribius pontilimi]|uniref:Glycolipid-binding domain-containing protein n=1 Tax=Palleronia pontilimi TaxID=1964209 RepID=A0A934ICA7_9RHOB|nr:putative glycolipid-binding domain-containing protein [Palleronia pontilimi]MBJ3764528.1 putative glycolipid-binding domain-containing protein [Palleronia pontilimi]